MYANIKLKTGLLLFLFPACLYSQETIRGTTTSTGVKTINVKSIAEFEAKYPPAKTIKIIPNQVKIKPVIANPVDAAVPLFRGKTTTIKPDESTGSGQRTQEFPCTNFNALNDNGASFPPDVNGAVGFDYLMTTLNTEIRIQNKQGGIISTLSLNGFWNGAGGHTVIFDPKITYDPYERRWIFVCCASSRSANSAVLLAVSQTADPTGNWTIYDIDADPGNQFWLDYPSIGFNRNWITIGGYMFNNPGQTNTQRTRMMVINKAEAYAGHTISIPTFDHTDYFHIAPAITYSRFENTVWCVSVDNRNSSNSGFVRLFSITGTAAAPVFNVLNTINVGGAWSNTAVNGPQLNSTTGINLSDDRILQTVFRNGALWFGHNVFLPSATPTTCASQIVAINTLTQTATENIRTTANANTMTAYPSIAVNRNNDLFFGYTSFRSNSYPTATISFRRSGAGFFFYYYKAGEDWYVKNDNLGRNRWGDYSSTMIDPEDDVTAWTIQEYARPQSFGTGLWGTWWAKVCPGSCLNDLLFLTNISNLSQKYEASNTITSSALINDNSVIKYDAATRVRLLPGFRVTGGSRFQAYIEGCGGSR